MPKFAIALILFALAAPLVAQEPVPPRFRIAIDVTVPHEDLQERVSMYLRNELRGLGDVEVAEDNADFRIYALVTEMNAGGGRIAYVLGISVASYFPDGYFDSILRTDLANAEEVASQLEALTVYRNQFISIAGPEEADLIETVANSVKFLNKHMLDPERAKN